jgi:hypothetical protein
VGLSLAATRPLVAQDAERAEDATGAAHRLSVVPRINAGAYFPYGGAYLSNNLTIDATILYERARYGLFVFKSQDLEDRGSGANYLQPGLFTDVRIRENVSLRFVAGYLFSQTEGFRDREGSDYYAATVLYWTIGERLTVENTALLFDLNGATKLTNRVLASVRVGPAVLDAYLWQRVEFDERLGATSASIAITPPALTFSETTSLEITLSYLGYLSRSRPSFARRDGFVVSIAAPLGL